MSVTGTLLALALLALLQTMLGGRAGVVPVFCVAAAAAVVVGARAFRTPGEPVEPLRPWWKATGHSVASLVLAGVAAWALFLQVISVIYATDTDVEGLVGKYSLVFLAAFLVALYLNSGVRQVVGEESTKREGSARTFRIATLGGKLLYVLAYAFANVGIVLLGGAGLWLLGLVLDLGFLLVGVRVFRGQGEEIAPPRAWWRASGRPTASFVLAGVVAAVSATRLVGALVNDPDFATGPPEFGSGLAFGVFALALYLNSGIRLRRQTAPAPRSGS
jgi:hypothetical protein